MHRLLTPPCRARPSAVPAPNLIFSRGRAAATKRKRIEPTRQKNALFEAKTSRFEATTRQRATGSRFTVPAIPTPKPIFPRVSEQNLLQSLSIKASSWIKQLHVRQRLKTYGIPSLDIPIALSAFEEALRTMPIFEYLGFSPERMRRLADDLSNTTSEHRVDAMLTSLFYEWASHPKEQAVLSALLSPAALSSITSVFHAADLVDPGASFPFTRQSQRRKIIMHVGPTNSGKTYNALRALAAAPYGVYAGPLRLLAHEIFERLNNGQIVPLGQDPDVDAEPDEDFSLDVAANGAKPAIQKKGDKRYVRLCNLLTGEEQRIVDETAGLLSCTVEMAPVGVVPFDVAVIDEIQMIADPERGSAWSSALLSLNAKEIHLCGEETAVPVIERIVRDLGDEFEVNRYQRLSPLTVAAQPLFGDFSKARKGDCFVAFSRSQIFHIKHSVERATGMKCAVAYGRLPPELRTEQAALFNKPGTGYDIMVGSDAIGMGLNLKIKRVIFDTTTKWNGSGMTPLSLSSIKQIAGRAGRFGMHGDEDASGEVTTLWPEDLPVVKDALKATAQPLKYARVHPTQERFEQVVHALPAGTPLSTAEMVFEYVSRIHPSFELRSLRDTAAAFDHIDRIAGQLTLGDRQLLRLAPIQWRDESVLEATAALMRMFLRDMIVDYRQLFRVTGIQRQLDEIEQTKESGGVPPPDALTNLESVHKLVIEYLWLSFRSPVVFSQRAQMTDIKIKVEKLMEWCLAAGNLTKAKGRFNGNAQKATKGPPMRMKTEDLRKVRDEVWDDEVWDPNTPKVPKDPNTPKVLKDLFPRVSMERRQEALDELKAILKAHGHGA